MGWQKFDSHKTTIKQRAAARAKDAADRKAVADRNREADRAICDAIMADYLNEPLTPEQRAEQLERVNRRYSLRPRSW